jgi:acetate kinase
MATRDTTHAHVLTINAGSSSLKAGLFAQGVAQDVTRNVEQNDERVLISAEIDRIGSERDNEHGSTLRVASRDDENSSTTTHVAAADHAAALELILDAFDRQLGRERASFDAVAHRVVHGGHRYSAPQRVDRALLDELRRLVPIDPNHLPQAISLIERIAQRHADVMQIACFDTAFHRTLPRIAQMYALPPRFWDAGVRRYGFHGLSCEFIIESLRATDPAAANGRVIIAHLGNGASMTAVRAGKSVETTMGFSPTGGLVMGTRLGDVDPSVVLFAAHVEHADAGALSRLVNNEAGLQGVSQTSHDMRDLLAREATDPRAADAIALFCHAAKKHLGALTAVLGGVDTLIFTGGIGEHAAPVRERICDGLDFLARTSVRVMKTDEDRMLARHAWRIMQSRVER